MKELAALEVAIVKLVIVSLILFGFLWLVKLAIRNTPVRKSVRSRIDRILPSIEGIVWFGFMLWSAGQLIQNEVWNAIGVLIIILLLLVLLFWLVIRDYVAGIILKTDGSIKTNDWIRVRDIEGKIKELGGRTMIVRTESGETVNIPYSTISGEISAKPNPAEEIINHSFEIKLSKATDAETAITQIKKSILNAPWSSVKKNPEIRLINDNSSYYHFEINLFSLRTVYFQKIKEYLIHRLATSGYEKVEL